MLFDEDRAGESEQCCRVGEHADDVGAAFDLLVDPFHQPALVVRSRHLAFSVSSTELVEVAGEGFGGGGVPGGFAVPASSFGIGSEALDIVQLVGDGVGELGTGG